MAHGIEMI